MSFLATLEMYLHKLILGSYQSISCYLAPSQFLAAKVLAWGLPKDKVKQLYYSLDLPQIKPQEGPGSGLVYVGRLIEEKGILTLLEAMKQLPDINLQIVGTGPQKPEIERMISAYGLPNVTLVGHKSGQQLSELISRAKLTIVPSIWYENNPLAILESFALAKPVIGSDLGGIPELVQPNKTGLLFKPSDADDLASKIKSLYYDDEKLKAMGQNCRQWVENNCEPKKHLEEILKIYKEVLK
jgi:glycosyltransferase involved in cell wall biosynthesis